MGASPTPIPWPELFTSFQTGVVEGTQNGITDIMGMKFPDAGLKYLTLDGHSYMGALWYMNNDRFMGLDEGHAPRHHRRFRRSAAGNFRLAKAQVDRSLSRSSPKSAVRSMCRPWKKKPSSRMPRRRCSNGSRPMFEGGATFYDLLVAEAAKASEMIDGGAMMDLK
jgi:hypothetical protein